LHEEQIFSTEKCPRYRRETRKPTAVKNKEQNLEQRQNSKGNSATRTDIERPSKELKKINLEKPEMLRRAESSLQKYKDSNIRNVNILKIYRSR
jgi:hypothetical protein